MTMCAALKFASIRRIPEITRATANAFHSIYGALFTSITMLTGRQMRLVMTHGMYFLIASACPMWITKCPASARKIPYHSAQTTWPGKYYAKRLTPKNGMNSS